MELYAVKFGEDFKFAKYENVYKGMGKTGRVTDFIFLRYILIHNGKVVLIDTGFRDEKVAEKMGVTLLEVDREVKNIIGDISNIDTILITHSHFDHIDNLDLYGKPTVIISKQEYDFAMDKSPEPVKARLTADNVILVDEEYSFDNKFRFKVIGGHTPGSSVIYFENDGKNYVIASDECYMCDNIYKNVPNGNCFNSENNESFISDAHSKGLIPLPFHDISIFKQYERVSENIVRII